MDQLSSIATHARSNKENPDSVGAIGEVEYDAGIISKYFKVYIFAFYDIYNNLKVILLTFRNIDI